MRPASLLLFSTLVACAIPPPPPESDPIPAAYREDGRLALSDATLAAACVSQQVPGSIVALRRDGAVVRPAPGMVQPGGPPDHALVLERQEDGAVAWHLLVGETGPEAAAVAQGLNRALGDCAARLGGVG